LREQHRLRVFEDRAVTKVFEPRKEEATGEWRRLHTEKLYDLYS
jgi:hypothetical protein